VERGLLSALLNRHYRYKWDVKL